VEVPEPAADMVIAAMQRSTIRGRRPSVRRERFVRWNLRPEHHALHAADQDVTVRSSDRCCDHFLFVRLASRGHERRPLDRRSLAACRCLPLRRPRPALVGGLTCWVWQLPDLW